MYIVRRQVFVEEETFLYCGKLLKILLLRKQQETNLVTNKLETIPN